MAVGIRTRARARVICRPGGDYGHRRIVVRRGWFIGNGVRNARVKCNLRRQRGVNMPGYIERRGNVMTSGTECSRRNRATVNMDLVSADTSGRSRRAAVHISRRSRIRRIAMARRTIFGPGRIRVTGKTRNAARAAIVALAMTLLTE